jgi:hypothetical protein
VVEDVTPPELAPIALLPVALVVANPETLGALATVATLADDELQCVVSVMSCVVPSLNDPVAVNCCVLPRVTVGFSGVTAMELSVPVPTVRVVVPVTPAALAETVTLPPFLPCAKPEART